MRKDKFYEKLRGSSFRTESCIEEGILFLSSDVLRTMKSNECYRTYTKESVAITLVDKLSLRKYSDMDTTGQQWTEMQQIMPESAIGARNMLEFQEPRLLR